MSARRINNAQPSRGKKKRTSRQMEIRTVFLIICEGDTERYYFDAIRREKHLGDEVIDAHREGCTDALSIVNIALQYYQEQSASGITRNIWCVFDKDENSTEQLNQARNRAGKKVNIAFSNPCFDLWYLFHFHPQSAHIERGDVVHAIKTFIPDYEKPMPDAYRRLQEKVLEPHALAHAKMMRDRHLANCGQCDENPSTGVDILVTALNAIESRR